MDLEAELTRLRAEVVDPRAGLFGPGSKLWELNRHSVIFMGAGRAALLQLAHPWVAHAIDQHSKTRADPMGRFNRTFRRVFAMVYGDLDAALHAARRVHAIHATVEGELSEDVGAYARGTRYRANDVDALIWVHATLWETSVRVYEWLVRPLSPDEKERYYAETRRFAHLFGIPDSALPEDWSAFLAYNECMWSSDRLVVGRPAAQIAQFLFRPLHPALAPVARWYRVVTAALLPPRIRAGFGLRADGPVERRIVAATGRLLRGSHPLWPRRLRYLPAYIAAERRLAGNTSPDRIGALLERALEGRSRPD